MSAADPSLFTYHKDKIRLYMVIYVDDILLTGNSKAEIARLLENLHHRFELRDLGSLNHFLRIQATNTKHGILLHLKQYAQQILLRAGMQETKPVTTPVSTKVTLNTHSQEPYTNTQLYRQLIGALQYLTLTRLDIQFARNQLSQFMHNPLNVHFETLKRLLRYIKGTIDKGISLYRDSLILSGYVDSDWATNSHDRKSITGYCYFMGKSIISWQVKKQTSVARSSTEAEYRALATAATKMIWLRRLLEDFHIPQKEPTLVYCDNTSTIALANNPVFHARTKHIDVDSHFFRDCIQNNKLTVHHMCTNDQIADIFTKPLSILRFRTLASKLIIDIPSSV
ncbi:uncharacterized protein LOC110093814 [Dendrobium catenatum]|uniref:uncharacterized protein LOC110093814 n=1 Tax=Dendrobium catenatum TaxID=906689 RepID=UPI0010A0868B|nr:uncharacterized protein LOC110093814 [Dendrobium catenatum]